MQEIKIFENADFGIVRTAEIDGKPYFVANDIAKSLGYVETAKAIRTHCKGVSEMDIPSNGGIQRMKIIPEGDVYRLIVRSKLPQAEKFESWVFDEVLPSIRQTGIYGNLDIQALVSETVKQTVFEVTKQIMPLLLEHNSEFNPKRRNDYKGIIEKADIDIRQEVDEMLFSGRFTYAEVAVFLNENGVKTTYSSVQRYAKKMGLR